MSLSRKNGLYYFRIYNERSYFRKEISKIIIYVGSLKAHKLLLSFLSPVFKKQFYGTQREPVIEVGYTERTSYRGRIHRENQV